MTDNELNSPNLAKRLSTVSDEEKEITERKSHVKTTVEIQTNGEISDTNNVNKTPSIAQSPVTPTSKTINKSLLRKGILRNAKSEPVIMVSQASPSRHAFSYPRGKYNVSSKGINHATKSSQEFINPAFELDETLPTDYKIADIFQQALAQVRPDEYIHPYGRGNLYSAVFLGEKTKVQASGGHLAFWIIFLLCMVGIAGAVILMAEMYKLQEKNNNVTISDYDG